LFFDIPDLTLSGCASQLANRCQYRNGGSIAGTWMSTRWNAVALYLPVGILLISVGVDQFYALSVEEKDQV
jgi:hypothetical protein